MRNDTKESLIQREGAGRCNEANKKGVKQADRQVDTDCGQTGQVLPPQSPGCKKAWQGKCNRILRGRKKMFRASKKNQRGRSRNMKEKQNLQQKEMSSLIYRSDMIGGICILCSVNQF